jgi:hypothetical protein
LVEALKELLAEAGFAAVVEMAEESRHCHLDLVFIEGLELFEEFVAFLLSVHELISRKIRDCAASMWAFELGDD